MDHVYLQNGNNGASATNGAVLDSPADPLSDLLTDAQSPVDSYADLVRRQLQILGHDTEVNGLRETPDRVSRFHSRYFAHVQDPIQEAALLLKPFDAPANPGFVSVTCSFSSFCEHHLLPFFGTAQVVYLPGEEITGLSKISRVITSLSSRPQIQERITSETAEVLMKLQPVGVLVDMVAEHTCMRVRGVTDPCSHTRTRVLRGAFETDSDSRSQALGMLD